MPEFVSNGKALTRSEWRWDRSSSVKIDSILIPNLEEPARGFRIEFDVLNERNSALAQEHTQLNRSLTGGVESFHPTKEGIAKSGHPYTKKLLGLGAPNGYVNARPCVNAD
jgi:hypothetical protein